MRNRPVAALTLVEVLLAGLILITVMLPALEVFVSSSAETVKARSRLIAVNVASAMIEEMRARPAPARGSYSFTSSGAPGGSAIEQLPAFAAILSSYRSDQSSQAAALDQLLSAYTGCSATVGTGSAPGQPGSVVPSVVVSVGWTEGGVPAQLGLDGLMGNAP